MLNKKGFELDKKGLNKVGKNIQKASKKGVKTVKAHPKGFLLAGAVLGIVATGAGFVSTVISSKRKGEELEQKRKEVRELEVENQRLEYILTDLGKHLNEVQGVSQEELEGLEDWTEEEEVAEEGL